MGASEGSERTREYSGLDATIDSFFNERRARELSNEVLASIQSLGYAHLRQPLTTETFDIVAQQLGSIALRTDLTITRNRSSIVYKPDEIAFHQDNPVMNILGWFCLQQDEVDGSALLLDTSDVADYFSRSELKIMGNVMVEYPTPIPCVTTRMRAGCIPSLAAVTEKETRCEVYYVPGCSTPMTQKKAEDRKFAEYLRGKEPNQVIRSDSGR